MSGVWGWGLGRGGGGCTCCPPPFPSARISRAPPPPRYAQGEWDSAIPRVDDAWHRFLAAIKANGDGAGETPLASLDLRDNNLELPAVDVGSMVLAEGAEAPLPVINWPDQMALMLADEGCKITKLLVS